MISVTLCRGFVLDASYSLRGALKPTRPLTRLHHGLGVYSFLIDSLLTNVSSEEFVRKESVGCYCCTNEKKCLFASKVTMISTRADNDKGQTAYRGVRPLKAEMFGAHLFPYLTFSFLTLKIMMLLRNQLGRKICAILHWFDFMA